MCGIFPQATPTAIPPGTTPSADKLADLTLIEKRLDNWFLNQSQSSNQFTSNVNARWQSLQADITDAFTNLASLSIAKSVDGVITGKHSLLYSDLWVNLPVNLYTST